MSLPRHRLALSVTALATAFLVSGCVLVVDSSSRYLDGPLQDNQTLAAIEPGQTTRDSVIDSFGRPAGTYVNDDGNEVLRYVSVQERETEIAVFLLFAMDLSGEEVRTLHIEIEDGTVKSYRIE